MDALLTLARADRVPNAPVSVDLTALVEERLAAWSARAAERDVRLDARPSGSVHALATPGRTEQVLDSLLANAATSGGGTIAVSAERDVGHVALHVVDEGPGMTPEARRRAFDRFWRDHAGDGFGLGLSIVELLVRADGGTVELLEAPSGGLDATVRFPARGTRRRARLSVEVELPSEAGTHARAARPGRDRARAAITLRPRLARGGRGGSR